MSGGAIVLSVACVAALGIGLARVCLAVVTVDGASMSPTLESGDRLLVCVCWPPSWYHVADIVTVMTPATLGGPTLHVKRIARLGRSEGHRWAEVLGDNRAQSLDSKQWGARPLSALRGRVILRLTQRDLPSQGKKWSAQIPRR